MALILKFGTKIDGQAFGRVSGVKNSAEPQPSTSDIRRNRFLHNAGRGRNASASLNSGIRESGKILISPALARVEVYSIGRTASAGAACAAVPLMTFADRDQRIREAGERPVTGNRDFLCRRLHPDESVRCRRSSLTGLYRNCTPRRCRRRTPDAVSDVASPVSSPSIFDACADGPNSELAVRRNRPQPSPVAMHGCCPANAVTPGAPATMAEVSPAYDP